MKVRKFKIVIAESAKEAMAGFKKSAVRNFKLAQAGRLNEVEHDLILTLTDVGSLAKIFSPERVRLIRTVKDEKPESIYQLAKLLNRAEQNVWRDVQDLAKYGIIHLKKVRKKGQKQETIHPEYNWDGFDIAV